MPRPTRAMGRPGTTVIPPGWSESHAAVIAGTLQSQVTIGAAGAAPTWNEGRGQTETTAAVPVYDGPATLMLLNDRAHPGVVAAEDTVATRIYEVTLPYDASDDVAVGMVLTVGGSNPDPMLAGKTLTLSAVERGTRRFSRVLLAVLND